MNRKTLARHRFQRTSAEGGGGGTGGTGGTGGQNDQNDQQQQQSGGQNDHQQQVPVEATDADGVGLGFPKDTAVEKMTDKEQAAYWRNQSKVQQKRVPTDLAQLQQDAQAWREHQAKQNPPAGPQNVPTREQIEAEVRQSVNQDAALALLRTSLHTRGKNAAEIDDLLQFVTPAAFLTAEKGIDTTKVTTYLDRVAPAGSGGRGTRGLPGQGNREQGTPNPGAAGKAESERRGFTKASQNVQRSPLLPQQN